MITLIIFLLIIFSLFVLIQFIKINIFFEIKVRNFNVFIKIKILNKIFQWKVLLKRRNLNENYNIKNELKQNNMQLYIEIFKNIIEVLELKRINLNVLVGALFMIPTIFLTVFISSLIPNITNLPFKKKGKLSFLVLPIYDTLSCKIDITSEFKVTIYNLILILVLLKRFKILSFINSELHNKK